jgi:hypothetical protein
MTPYSGFFPPHIPPSQFFLLSLTRHLSLSIQSLPEVPVLKKRWRFFGKIAFLIYFFYTPETMTEHERPSFGKKWKSFFTRMRHAEASYLELERKEHGLERFHLYHDLIAKRYDIYDLLAIPEKDQRFFAERMSDHFARSVKEAVDNGTRLPGVLGTFHEQFLRRAERQWRSQSSYDSSEATYFQTLYWTAGDVIHIVFPNFSTRAESRDCYETLSATPDHMLYEDLKRTTQEIIPLLPDVMQRITDNPKLIEDRLLLATHRRNMESPR